MPSKIIGIDLDETIVQTVLPSLELFKQRYSCDLTYDRITAHDWYAIDGVEISRDIALAHWEYFFTRHDINAALLPVPDAITSVQSLIEAGHQIYIITARQRHRSQADTHAWLHRYLPALSDRVIFCSVDDFTTRSKHEVCMEIGAELFIDDNIDYALPVAHSGVTTLLLEKPWNRQRTEAHPSLIRVKDWSEIGQQFQKLGIL